MTQSLQKSAFALGIGCALLSCLRAEVIPVFLEPDLSANRIATIDPDQFYLIESYPVLDSVKAAEGWLFAEYDGTFVGFVDPNRVTKGLGVRANTPVYLRPDNRSPVLSLIRDGDTVEVKHLGTDWVEIEFQKRVPVYFIDPEVTARARSEPQPQPEPEPRPEPRPERLPERDPESPIPVEPLTRTDREERAPRELDPIRTPPAIDVAPGLGPDRDRRPHAPIGAPASDVPRFMEGTLVRASRLFGFTPRYQWELKAAGNRRLAWVDLSGVLVSSLAEYEGKQVRIYGEVQTLQNGREQIIFARTMRLRQ